MKTMRITTLLSAALLTPATHALAETGARQDSSQFLIWAFLGMCALIVVMQLMPVVILAFGLVKGLLKGKETPVEAKAVADK
jgi:hypothetical protein